jgi:ABC-type nitrate/sulfonate/bicarbonate transport system substrate-binding protein
VAASGFAFALLEILARGGLGRADVELVELGSTPKRLQALLADRCAATMLNAGNDLRADDAGLVRLADVTSVAAPYLGTVLAVQGEPTPEVRRFADALRATTAAVLSGAARDVALEEAGATGLPAHLAARYVDRLADPDHGLVADGLADVASLESVVALRRAHSADALETATSPAGGLLDAAVA